MRNRFIRMLLAALCILGTNLSLAEEGARNVSERHLEQSIDQVIRIFSDDVVTDADYQFVLSVPKEVIPLLIRRLEKDGKSSTKYSSAFDLLSNKLKQFEGEIPNDVRHAAINLMVRTCESASDQTALPYLLGFRDLRDPKITEMARRMKDRPDVNVQQASARLLDGIDTAPPQPGLQGLTATPAPITVPPSLPPGATVQSSPSSEPALQTPAVPAERKSPMWPLLVVILVLLIIVTVTLKRGNGVRR